jgi:ribosome-associated toxin RatA of RatAB toxin-antitoxin module
VLQRPEADVTDVASASGATVEIAAEPAAVMAVIADFEAYPAWVSQLKQVVIVDAGENGRAATVRFELVTVAIADSYTLAYDWSRAEEVSWRLVEATTFTKLDGSYRLRRVQPGLTEVEYQLAVGLDLPMIGAIRRTAEKILISTALASLKRRVEG